MPYNGAGGFTSLGAPTFPAVAGEIIYANRFNDTMNDVFSGLSVAWPRDGQAAATANIPMAGFRFTNLGTGTALGQAITFGQSGASLVGLTITDALTVNAPLVSYSAAVVATVAGSWNFTAVSAMLVPTAAPGTSTQAVANTNFVATAINAAAASIAGGTVSYPAAAYYAAATFGGF